MNLQVKLVVVKMRILLLFLYSFSLYAFDHNHTDFQNLLDKNLKVEKKQALINYRAIKKSPLLLEAYLKKLSSVTTSQYDSWNREQRLAFLINAYNAFTIELIIRNYPVKSIRDIGTFFQSPWNKTFFTLLDKKRSLDWLEHKKIRKDFKEPRIHFAVVCASMSCPNLQTKVFVAKNLEKQLESAAIYFINDQKKNTVIGKKLYLSKIFKWYGSDFQDMRLFIKRRLSEDVKTEEIEWLDYDWSLNEWK
ncbi:DUF547 domain-containing protein [Halobacteriovorax sp. HLS]|uniref:DUF547 domain-containing protein n=1 Tax=Halobacteriovorax sp. HLS TaxID=2234000 RepID=UPI000FD9A84B|nr:DUF547 domain-containing protein [Halobacteriovorax sp. HLS]